ncbi:unnamed protein product [Withania somnifera]
MEHSKYEIEECRGVLRVYSDGTIVRSNKPSFEVPIHDDGSILWKDVIFEAMHNLQLPPRLLLHSRGGFCIGSRTWPNCQNYCFKLASSFKPWLRAVKWLRDQAVSDEPDTWLTDVADFSHVFISGDSAGGNIAHHLAVRLKAGSAELNPVRVRGYMYLLPFFGGTERTKFEAEGPKEAFLNIELIDRFWRLSIPIGTTNDHPLVNPFGPNSPNLEKIDLDPILVLVGGCDLLKDRAIDYANKLKNYGKKIEYVEFEGQQHGFFTIDPNSEPSKKLMLIIKKFIQDNSS